MMGSVTCLNIAGGTYVEVRCNAGYELSGRNLGFQFLGTGHIGYRFTPGASGNNPSDYRDYNWPSNSDYTPCIQENRRRHLNPFSHKVAISRRAYQDKDDRNMSRGLSVRDNSCRLANNGECDLPPNCPVGTDSLDCDPPDSSCQFSQSVPASGSWNLEPRTCTKVSCGSFPSVVGGTVTPSGERKFGETVAITCDTGFTLTGDNRFSATPVCQANGIFTSGKLCAKSACGSFSPVFSHGSAFPSSGVVSGQYLLITCDEGYEVRGDPSILCESGVYQTTNQLSCHRNSCGNFQVANGRAVPSTNILFGDKADIKCNAGYFLSQQSAGSQNQAECTTYGLSAVCCSVLPCVSVCCRVAQRVTVCCSVLQCDLCYCGSLKC